MSEDIYQSWRDQLLAEVSECICKPCTDPRKEHCSINYDNPLQCGCRCERVEKILELASKIDEDIERASD